MGRHLAWPLGVNGRAPGGEAQLRSMLQLIRPPPYNPEWQAKYDALRKDLAAMSLKDATFKSCTRDFPGLMEGPYMFEVAITPKQTFLVFENDEVRHIHTDGRSHPGADDLWPTRLGDSVGHWEGDTLVVETVARFATEPLTIRAWAAYLSDQARFTERIRKVSRDQLEDRLVIEDPVALERPWHITLTYSRVKELDRLIPEDCIENERNQVIDGKMTTTP